MSPADIWERVFRGEGNCQLEHPGSGVCLVCWRTKAGEEEVGGDAVPPRTAPCAGGSYSVLTLPQWLWGA